MNLWKNNVFVCIYVLIVLFNKMFWDFDCLLGLFVFFVFFNVLLDNLFKYLIILFEIDNYFFYFSIFLFFKVRLEDCWFDC